MKLILSLTLFLLSLTGWANEVKIEINPSKPVAGETFQAYFRIFTDSDEEPTIDFNPYNLEVVGKSNQGVSTRTVYANGKLTVTREMTIVYDLTAPKAGRAGIGYITIQIGDQKLKHPAVNFTVLAEPQELGDVFVMADVPKRTLYLGEGVVVRYYLYSKVPVSNLDIKNYPKLNRFLKRFIQEPERTERVSVDGQLYLRTQIYAAKLYPEKTGKLKVDPLRLSVTYPSTRLGDPFGAFGLNRDFKTRTIGSDTVEVEVNPLPQPVPSNFTGLVGRHDFQLQLGQTKLIVNEPLEVKLTVSGTGALENLEAPVLLKHPGLEEFETNGDLKISNADQATKVFDYTFLAQENLNLPAKEVTLSYFDPSTEKYESAVLQIPAIVVAGGGPVAEKKSAEQPAAEKKETQKKDSVPQDFAAPVVVKEWEWKEWLPYINLSLAGLAVFISMGFFFTNKSFFNLSKRGEIPAAFRKGKFHMSDFVKWMTPLIRETGKSPTGIIKEAPLSEESKQYFIDLLSSNDYKEYSSRKSQTDFVYKSSHFKELGKYIESRRNENT